MNAPRSSVLLLALLGMLVGAHARAAVLPPSCATVTAAPDDKTPLKDLRKRVEAAMETDPTAAFALLCTTIPRVARESGEQSVDLAYQSLTDTGKNPRRSPKWFKSAELATRDLERRIASLQDQMSYTDRALLDKVKARVQQVHDELLLGLMEGKKK